MTVEIKAAVDEAFAAASKATSDFLTKHGDRDACGFAWVIVKPANSKLAKYLKEKHQASKHYDGGVNVWNPSLNMTQNISAKEMGARAFVDVILKHFPDTRIYSGSRMD